MSHPTMEEGLGKYVQTLEKAAWVLKQSVKKAMVMIQGVSQFLIQKDQAQIKDHKW